MVFIIIWKKIDLILSAEKLRKIDWNFNAIINSIRTRSIRILLKWKKLHDLVLQSAWDEKIIPLVWSSRLPRAVSQEEIRSPPLTSLVKPWSREESSSIIDYDESAME